MTGVMEHCDDKSMEHFERSVMDHCDDMGYGAL